MRLIAYVTMVLLIQDQHILFSLNDAPPTRQQSTYITPIRALTSSNAPKDLVWVHATVINIDEEDAPIIQDATGKIVLFLPTDELLALKIPLQSEIYVLGRIDVSPVHPSKNEFYAERIILAKNKQNENS